VPQSGFEHQSRERSAGIFDKTIFEIMNQLFHCGIFIANCGQKRVEVADFFAAAWRAKLSADRELMLAKRANLRAKAIDFRLAIRAKPEFLRPAGQTRHRKQNIQQIFF